MRDASERLKYLNIILAIIAFPVLGLAARDYLALRYRPQLKVQQQAPWQNATAAPSFESFSPILEKGLFPTAVRTLTRIDLVKAGPGGDASSLLSIIKLLGTYSGKRGLAVFEKAGSAEQEVFKTGDKVFDAGVLTAVGPESATVSTGASEVTFTIYKEDIPGGLSEMGKTNAPDEGARQGGYSEKISENEWKIDQKAVLSSLDDMSKIMTDARLTPKKAANGAIEGFLVNEIKSKGIFDAIGMKNGDVLTSINGYKIDSPEKAVQVLSALRGEESISLDIIREGKPRSFKYSIR